MPRFALFAIFRLVMLLCQLQARCNKFLVLPGSFYPGRRFLLKGVKRVNGPFETHRVNRAVRVSIVVIHDFKDARAFAFPRLGLGCLPPSWAIPSALPISSFTSSGNAKRSLLEEPTQISGFSPGLSFVAPSLSPNGYKYSTGNSRLGANKQGKGGIILKFICASPRALQTAQRFRSDLTPAPLPRRDAVLLIAFMAGLTLRGQNENSAVGTDSRLASLYELNFV